jgi:hypothetical protein
MGGFCPREVGLLKPVLGAYPMAEYAGRDCAVRFDMDDERGGAGLDGYPELLAL